MLSALSSRDYRLHWLGQTIALLGDQFHLIAMAWLVLRLTGDAVQLGLVLAVAGVARAATMLPGGALADRFTPRDIMIWSNVVRGVIAAALAFTVLGGHIEMWMVFAVALAFGVITGIFEPASQAAVPRLVANEELESGNSLVFFGDQLANFLGPAAAGALIGWFGMRAAETSPATDGSLVGVGVAFVVHAASFAVSIAFLAAMGRMAPATPDAENLHPLRAIGEAMRFVGSRPSLVTVLVLLAVANLFTVGPLLVGVPVLADTRLAEGPAALGMILSGFAFGNLFGVVLAGSMTRPAPRVLGAIVIALFVTFGAGIASLAWIERTWIAIPVLAAIGIGNGFLGVTVVTYLQRATPPAMIGRMMSLMMIAMLATMPASQAIAGFVIAMSPEALFLGAGAGLVLTGVVASTRREVREFGVGAADGEGSASAGDAGCALAPAAVPIAAAAE